ncbi:MAG: hypothetical protein ACE5E6_04270 [Phycisphaerae bacterium]
MNTVLAALFITGIEPISGRQRMLLIVPLCLSIAVVYKTLRCEDLRRVPLAAVILCGTIVLGMYVVAVGLWALYMIMA